MKRQLSLINNLIRTEDEFTLLVLDALRYDVFNDVLSNVVGLNRLVIDNVQRVHSPAVNTHSWFRDYVWTGVYDDITYVTATPAVSWMEKHGYRGTDHFNKICSVWMWGWNDDLGTVKAGTLVDAVKAVSKYNDKIVAHFIQPHMPHVGNEKLIPDDYGGNNLQEIGPNVGKERVRRTYRDNVIYVWNQGVRKIIDEVNSVSRPIIITSDHGELLGEEDMYGHNIDHEKVHNVPWVKI